jgi:hypothetical protein
MLFIDLGVTALHDAVALSGSFDCVTDNFKGLFLPLLVAPLEFVWNAADAESRKAIVDMIASRI